MKIAFVSPSFPPDICGVGSYTAKLADSLEGEDVETSLLTAENTSFNPLRIARVYSRLKKQRPDILHLQYPTQKRLSALEALLLFKAAKMLDIKTVITIHEHESFYSRKSQLRNKLLAKSANAVIVNSQRSYELFKLQGIESDIIHNGPTIEPDNGKRSETNGTVLTFFGFIAQHKNTLATIISIKRAYVDPDVSIRIVGNFNPSDSYHVLVKNQLGPKDDWLSGLNDAEVAKAIGGSTLAVLPFKHGVSEKNSTAISMFHLGVPVITNGPVPGALKGSVIDADADFGAKVSEVLHNKKQLLQIRDNATSLIEDDFNWKACAARHVQLYGRLTS